MRAAVLGSPIAHSLSPVLHAAAYAELGLAGWSYTAVECDQQRLPGLLRGCGPDWAGLSLTMPLKRTVLPLLDTAEPLVGEVGGANTVVFADGARHGYNTDVPGMITALTATGAGAGEEAPNPGAGDLAGGMAGRPGLILGAGATACAALAALRGLGISSATVAVRDPVAAGGLLAAADRLGMTVTLAVFEEEGQVSDGQLLISTVPAGAADSYAERIRPPGPTPAVVFDVVYHPWPTRLAIAAGQAGAAVIGGFELLLHQAARQVELMTGQPAPVPAMRRAGLAELDRRRMHDS